MSDHDRDPYSRASDRLSFDPREPQRGGGPAPITLIISAVVLVGIIAAVFFVYRGGVRHKGEGPAVVGAPVGQIKQPAPPEAATPPAGLVIDKTDTTASNATPAFAPPPEEPQARPIEAAATPPPAPVKPVQALPAGAAPAPVAASAGPPPPPATTAASTAGAAKPAHPAAKPAQPLTIASLTDQALRKPSTKPPAKPVTATPAATVAPTTSAAAPAAGTGWVQIGAFSSAALADKGWSDIAKLAPAAMTGKGKKVETVTRDGKTFYRTYITGFASRDAASAFCGKLKAAGKACFVK
jgi:cytoskeletal protein RodZ